MGGHRCLGLFRSVYTRAVHTMRILSRLSADALIQMFGVTLVAASIHRQLSLTPLRCAGYLLRRKALCAARSLRFKPTLRIYYVPLSRPLRGYRPADRPCPPQVFPSPTCPNRTEPIRRTRTDGGRAHTSTSGVQRITR
jgi:hypothetical protein